MISYLQAIVIGLLQGITELFPVSSLGHSVLIAELFGWHNLLAAQDQSESFFLSFLVVLHFATALALVIFYRSEWKKICGGFLTSIKHKKIVSSYEKLAWLLIVATIPAAGIGLIFEHWLRVQFAKPIYAASFLVINGIILAFGDRLRRNMRSPKYIAANTSIEKITDKISWRDSLSVGLVQVFALVAGISRSGITMIGALLNGLDYESAARFSFLLATPIILLASIYKLPSILLYWHSMGGQFVAGGLSAIVAAYLAVKYLDRYFQTKRLWPFSLYCIALGIFMILFIVIRG